MTEEERLEMEERRQKPRLSSQEIVEIAAAIVQAQGVPHSCRLSRVSEADIEGVIRIHHEITDEDLRETVKFFKNFNGIVAEGGRTIWKLILALGFTAVVGLLVMGLWAKIKSEVGG